MSPVDNLIAWSLTTLVSAFVGSYLGAYLKKKGENLATHEDLGNLVKQMEAVTTTTKQIEARISNEVWDRQRRWELKRDAILDATKKMGMLSRVISENAAAYLGTSQTAESRRLQVKAAEEWTDAMVAFNTATSVVALICGDAVAQTLRALAVYCSETVTRLYDGQLDMDTFGQNVGRVQCKVPPCR